PRLPHRRRRHRLARPDVAERWPPPPTRAPAARGPRRPRALPGRGPVARGAAILAARALSRPEVTSPGAPTRQVFQLHPNAYRFAEGHVAKLELLPHDYPYGLPSNGQASITVSAVELRLPVRDPPDGVFVQPPAAKLVPAGYQLAFCANDADCDDGVV